MRNIKLGINTGIEGKGGGKVNTVRQESQIVSIRRQTPKQENRGSVLYYRTLSWDWSKERRKEW